MDEEDHHDSRIPQGMLAMAKAEWGTKEKKKTKK